MSREYGQVSTLTLLGFVAAILAWEVEIAVVLLHVFVERALDPLAHAALLAVLLALYRFCRRPRQARIFACHAGTRTACLVTRGQAAIIIFSCLRGRAYSV